MIFQKKSVNRKKERKDKALAQVLMVRKMVELGLEARLTKSCRSQLLCSRLLCRQHHLSAKECVTTQSAEEVAFVKPLTSDSSLGAGVSTTFYSFL